MGQGRAGERRAGGVMPVMDDVHATEAQGADAEYRARLGRGEFAIPECRECRKVIFYPRVVCPHCGSERLAWIQPSGNGAVYSTTVVRGREGAHNVALIDLAEGARLMSRVVGLPPEEVRIGMAVRAKVEGRGDDALLVFEAAQ